MLKNIDIAKTALIKTPLVNIHLSEGFEVHLDFSCPYFYFYFNNIQLRISWDFGNMSVVAYWAIHTFRIFLVILEFSIKKAPP